MAPTRTVASEAGQLGPGPATYFTAEAPQTVRGREGESRDPPPVSG